MSRPTTLKGRYKKQRNSFIMEESKRKLDNTVYSFGTLTLNGILSSNNKIVNFITRKGLGFVENNKYLKKLFIKSATGKDFFKTF